MFPYITVPMPGRYIVTNWVTDPFSLGAYCYLPLGCTADEVDLLSPPEAKDRLYFAGEGTMFEYQGALHGAYLTGKNQAERIATRYKKTDVV